MFYNICSLRMFAVFSVVISISGSVKYSDATHLPFSDPARKHTETMLRFTFRIKVCDAWRNKTKPKKACVSLHFRSQVTIMFCDSYGSRGQKLAISLFTPSCSLTLLLYSTSFWVLVAMMMWTYVHTQQQYCWDVCLCLSMCTCISSLQ